MMEFVVTIHRQGSAWFLKPAPPFNGSTFKFNSCEEAIEWASLNRVMIRSYGHQLSVLKS